jgi:hypothetical protein
MPKDAIQRSDYWWTTDPQRPAKLPALQLRT